MDTALISALAALAGSATGGLTSFLSSWIGLQGQLKSQLYLTSKQRREDIYRDFIVEASSLYIDAMTRDTPELPKTIILYALISRMRILSSARVIDEAEKVTRLIVDLYPEANKTFEEIRTLANDHKLDPLKAFAQACREELEVQR
jgi:hypothetical protein